MLQWGKWQTRLPHEKKERKKERKKESNLDQVFSPSASD